MVVSLDGICENIEGDLREDDKCNWDVAGVARDGNIALADTGLEVLLDNLLQDVVGHAHWQTVDGHVSDEKTDDEQAKTYLPKKTE